MPCRPPRRLDDSKLCKNFLLGFCPGEEFQRTKHDYGTCTLDHDEAAKAQVGTKYIFVICRAPGNTLGSEGILSSASSQAYALEQRMGHIGPITTIAASRSELCTIESLAQYLARTNCKSTRPLNM